MSKSFRWAPILAVAFALLVAATAGAGTMASLGDSYSSGEGAGTYDGGTGGHGGCHRTYLAWPRLLGVAKADHLACSGATLDNLHPGHKANHPDNGVGELDRLARLAAKTRFDRVVMTMGGNDIGFATIVRNCVLADASCLNNLTDIRRHLQRLRPRLVTEYKKIVDAADAPLLVVGYPNILPAPDARAGGGCFASHRSRARAQDLIAALDATFSAAAAEARQTASHSVDFVSVAGALRGHELCTHDSWVHPISILTKQESAHPMAAGQWAIASAVQRWIAANTGQCTPSDNVAAIIDDSGSMETSDPEGIRARAMELLLSKPAAQGRTIGAVEFAGGADELFAPGVVSAQRSSMLAALNALQNDGIGSDDPGGTDYNAAFRASGIAQPQATSRIFLTDGAHNVGEYQDLHAGGPPTYVIGLDIGRAGEGSDDADRLGRIAAETGGTYYPLKLNEGDSPATQVARLQGVVNEIDAKLTCAPAEATTPTTLRAPNKRSAAVASLIASGQRAAEVVVTWGTEEADVNLSTVSVRDRAGRIIGDLDGKKRIRPHHRPKRTKLLLNTVEGKTFDIVTLPLPKGSRTMTVTVSAAVLPAPTDVTVQIRPVSSAPAPGTTDVQDGGQGAQTTPTPTPTTPQQPPQPPHRVDAYSNYGPATAGHAMCRGNPARPESMPGGTATQTFTVPSGVASLDSALVQIDPDSTVTAHAKLTVNGVVVGTADAAAAGDTRFSFSPVAVSPGDQAALSFSFTATFGKIITIYGAAAVGGTFTGTNSCSDGAPSFTSANGLRAVVSGWSP